MALAESIYWHSLNFPEDAAREALDFIEILELRDVTNKRTVQLLPGMNPF